MKCQIPYVLLLLAASAFGHAPERLLGSSTLKNSQLPTLNAHQYTYLTGGQRETQTRTDGSAVTYNCDDLGQLKKTLGAGGTWRPTSETRYVYDGMQVIQERDGNNTPLVSYTRGNDLSGSLKGAGGIGGLLGRSHGYSGGNWSTHNYYHADGAGNVTYLVNSNQTLAASYRYDPYGNLLASSGPLAAANVYRFSSKEIHLNSGLYSYGYRFYSPNWQRWLNQDPIGEAGGINLYQAFFNSPPVFSDRDGLGNFYNPKAGQNAVPDLVVSMGLGGGGAVANYRPGDDPLWILGNLTIPGGGPDTLLAPLGPLDDVATLVSDSSTREEKLMAAGTLAVMVITKKPCKPKMPLGAKGRPHFSGTDKPWTKGATPDSLYTHIDPKTGKAVQNAVYDSQGNVVGHVDFKNHGPGAASGHGHTFPQPGNPGSGHGPGNPHIPNNQLPPGWDTLPPGVQPRTPIGS